MVYSTCSVHQEENEQVVRDVLRSMKDFELVPILPLWSCRGWDTVLPLGKYCIRASPGETQSNGFFVACFQRKQGIDLPAPEGSLGLCLSSKQKRKRMEEVEGHITLKKPRYKDGVK